MAPITQDMIRIVSALPVLSVRHSLPSDDLFSHFHHAATRLLGRATTLDELATNMFGPAVMVPEQHADNPYVMPLSQNYLGHALQERVVTPGAIILSMNSGNEWLSRTYMTSPSPGRLFLRYDLIDKEQTVSGRPPVFLSTPVLDLRYQSAAPQLGPGEKFSEG